MSDWHTRYRRIIDAYRGSLLLVDEKTCRAVDIRVEDDWGEGWVTDDSIPDLDKFMTATQIAKMYGYSAQNIRDWARRHPDEITKHRQDGKTLFLLREVLRYQARR